MSCCCATVSTSEVGIIESFGKFARVVDAGCFFLCCPIEYLAARVSLRVQELNVSLETKTKDNVFVSVHVSVQYQVSYASSSEAFFLICSHHYIGNQRQSLLSSLCSL